MSTYWYYKFRGALRPDLRDAGIERIRELADERFGGTYLPDPSDSDWQPRGLPSMGPHIRYDWSRFDEVDDVSVAGGELRLAVFSTNLNWEPWEDEDGITAGATETRLDFLLRFLTWATVGPEGEVVGCIANEHSPGHWNPMVRCADGRIRTVSTPVHHDDGWFAPIVEEAVIPDRIPCDLILDIEGSRARLDSDALRKRYLAVDGTLRPSGRIPAQTLLPGTTTG